jgi:hypothetical protein
LREPSYGALSSFTHLSWTIDHGSVAPDDVLSIGTRLATRKASLRRAARSANWEALCIFTPTRKTWLDTSWKDKYGHELYPLIEI